MKKILFAACAALLLVACKKDDAAIETASGDGKYLKKVNYWTVATNKEVTIRELLLDAGGNLTGVKTYTNNVQGGTAGDVIQEYTGIEKDASGRITKISGQDKMQNKPLAYEFTYDAAGNITKAVLKQDGAAYRTRTYTYDSSNRLLTAEEVANNNSNLLVSVSTYTYTGTSENPATYKEELKLYNQSTTYTLKFDDKKNPSQAAPKILYPMGLGDFYKSNVTESTTGTTTTKITVTYNTAGYATSTTNGSGSGLKFVYGD